MLQEINYQSLGRRRILVAEDMDVNQLLIRRIIESWGLEVEIAVNGREAVDKVLQSDYDLILMDIQMPEMDGVEATCMIRQLPSQKASIPIVALTANFLKGDRERFKAAGMNDFLPKPFNESTLFVVISNNIDRRTKVAPVQVLRERRSANTPDKLYDLSNVRGMSGGDEVFVNGLVQLFITSTPELLQLMKQEACEGHWEAVSRAAHKLKGAVEAMGITAVKEELRTISVNGRHGVEVDKLPALVEQVLANLEPCLLQVKNDFPA